MTPAKLEQTDAINEALASDELPEGWVIARLPQCTEITMGQSPPGRSYNGRGDGLPFFQGKAQFGDRFPTVEVWRTSPEKIARAGDVLISVRAPVGPTNVADQTCAVGRGLAAITPLGSISTELILFALRLQEPELSQQGTGSTFTAINRSHLEELEIHLPPLPEQQRIVAKVEELLAEVNKVRSRLEKVPKTLKAFRPSVLAAACSGRLTEDWRLTHPSSESAALLLRRFRKQKPVKEEPRNAPFELPDPWTWAYFGELLDSIRGGSTVPPALERTDYPILRSSSVRQRFVDLTDVRYLSDDQSRNEENYIFDRDLLFTRLSGSLEYVANCGMVRDLGKRRIQYPDRLFCARLHPPLVSEYIELIFGASMIRRQIEEASKSSAGHQRVSIGDLEELLIPLPPVDEQEQIGRRVEALFKLADTIEKGVGAATRRADKLTQAILAKAFRGDLVPTEAELAHREGRTYEPAWELLERIKSERQKEAASKNTARRQGGRKQTSPKR